MIKIDPEMATVLTWKEKLKTQGRQVHVGNKVVHSLRSIIGLSCTCAGTSFRTVRLNPCPRLQSQAHHGNLSPGIRRMARSCLIGTNPERDIPWGADSLVGPLS